MARVQINIGSFFKLCKWDKNTDKYELVPDLCYRAFGSISEDILLKIIDINIDILNRLLGFNTSININRSNQIMDLFVLASKYSQEKKIIIFGYDVNEILEENMPQLSNFLDTHFEQSIDDIIQYSPATVKKYNNYGEQLKKLYSEKNYNEIIELMFKINDITMEFSLHLLLTMLNISYLLFIDLSIPTPEQLILLPKEYLNCVYENDIETIATKLAYGALQQYIINNNRKILYQHQILANLKEKYTIPLFILDSEDADEIESYIYYNICKTSKALKTVYPRLAIKRELPEPTPPDKIYNVWNGLDANKKSELALSFGFKKGDSFDMLPYILTIRTKYIERIREFSRFAIQTLLSQLDKIDIKHFGDLVKEYDDIFDYILFPDRENIIKIIDQHKKGEPNTIYTNVNAFEKGHYNGKYLLNKIVIGKGQYFQKILHKLLKQQ